MPATTPAPTSRRPNYARDVAIGFGIAFGVLAGGAVALVPAMSAPEPSDFLPSGEGWSPELGTVVASIPGTGLSLPVGRSFVASPEGDAIYVMESGGLGVLSPEDFSHVGHVDMGLLFPFQSYSLAIAPDGSALFAYSAGDLQQVSLTPGQGGLVTAQVSGILADGSVEHIASSPDGSAVYVLEFFSGVTYEFRVADGVFTERAMPKGSQGAFAVSVAVNPETGMVYQADVAGFVTGFDPVDFGVMGEARLSSSEGCVPTLATSNDGLYLYTSCGTLEVWNTTTWQLTMWVPGTGVQTIVPTSDRLFVFADVGDSVDAELGLIDLSTGSILQSYGAAGLSTQSSREVIVGSDLHHILAGDASDGLRRFDISARVSSGAAPLAWALGLLVVGVGIGVGSWLQPRWRPVLAGQVRSASTNVAAKTREASAATSKRLKEAREAWAAEAPAREVEAAARAVEEERQAKVAALAAAEMAHAQRVAAMVEWERVYRDAHGGAEPPAGFVPPADFVAMVPVPQPRMSGASPVATSVPRPTRSGVEMSRGRTLVIVGAGIVALHRLIELITFDGQGYYNVGDTYRGGIVVYLLVLGGAVLALWSAFVRRRPGILVGVIAFSLDLFLTFWSATSVHGLVTLTAITLGIIGYVQMGPGGAVRTTQTSYAPPAVGTHEWRVAQLQADEAARNHQETEVREWAQAYRDAHGGQEPPPGFQPPVKVAAAAPAYTYSGAIPMYQGYGARPDAGTNVFAILSLIFGILGGLLAIPFGFVALSQVKRTGERGRGMAIAGVILGFVWLAVLIAYYVWLGALLSSF